MLHMLSATLPSSDPIYFATTIVIFYFYMSIRSYCHPCIASAKSGNVSFHKPKFEISLSAAIAFPLSLAPIGLGLGLPLCGPHLLGAWVAAGSSRRTLLDAFNTGVALLNKKGGEATPPHTRK